MTLNSVVLPAPFGPMMPTSSFSPTCRSTSRSAVSPPNRLVTLVSSSSNLLSLRRRGRARPPPAEALRQLDGQPPRHEAHDDHQQHAVDDQVDAGLAGRAAAEGGAQVELEQGDQQRAEEGPDAGGDAADDRHQRELDRQVE